MDGQTIASICKKVDVLIDNFIGLYTFQELLHEKIQITPGDYLIVNIENTHWIALLCVGQKEMFVFDSLGIINQDNFRKMIFFSFDIVKVTFLGTSAKRVQNMDSLVCGEHAINFLIYEKIYYLQNKKYDMHYVERLIKYCKKIDLQPDVFVWILIYKKLRLASLPDLHEILLWKNNR
jgi:hypothetical protein